jgi:hypothetical protein
VSLYVRPFGIGEAGLVCSSRARYSTELLPPDPFADSFYTHSGEIRVRGGAVRRILAATRTLCP